MGLENVSVVAQTQLGEELRHSRDRRAVQLSRAVQQMASEKCCNSCYAEQQLKAYSKNKYGQNVSRLPYGPEPVCRNNLVQLTRCPNQAAPGTYKPPQRTTHHPYLNFGAGEPMSYYSHEGMSADIPKDCILCLRWISGLCGKKKNNATQKEADIGCPYAHPDLSEVPPGVCPTYWFTGFCRFNRKEDMQTDESMEQEAFGCHGWAHLTRVSFDVSTSDSSSDGEKDKKKGRRRPPSVCLACHHAKRKSGFPLLPGISCKMTVREREAALALYSDYMKNNW